MRRTALRTIAGAAIAAVIGTGAVAMSSGAAFAEEPSDSPVLPATPLELAAGRYIVMLDGAPTATYTGGTDSYKRTQPSAGKPLDRGSKAVQQYAKHLEQTQNDVAADAGVTVDDNLTFTMNAFTANLTADQAKSLSKKTGVAALVPDEILHVTEAVPSTDFLGLSGEAGVWSSVGGIDAAGSGIVVGVIDSGIAPEHPSFAGERLGTTAGAEPWIEGGAVNFDKADGTRFTSTMIEGQQWNLDDYSTKLVGGRVFSEGIAASGFDFAYDYLSPRDMSGHGTHTSSTAAGNNDVRARLYNRDFGPISGVAPAAKVAMYKACFDGPDKWSSTDDGCSLTDTMAAIDQATKDGVDVINYSIGGGSATTTLQAEDVAFYNAAAAGVFVSVSAGNSGPGASTADHGSPWYTTVGASTIPTYEATVTLGNGVNEVGVSIAVDPNNPLTAPLVVAADIAAEGVDAATAALCQADTLDPAKANGKIVICDRGGNARLQKSMLVRDAGGVGAIIVNPTPSSLDADEHPIPTIHVQNTVRDALLAYARGENATATLTAGNLLGTVTPTPQMGGFSSRGPVLAEGVDILKPDVTAPGVAILAGGPSAENADPTFAVMSGTSMSSPHVAGLGALYLGVHPNASPAEIKSALMTTAYDTVDAQGNPSQDPFAQGAGHVDPRKFLNPGLLYLNGKDDWAAYLQGTGLRDLGVEPIDPSDLNLASISIGSLAGSQTVTRTVTAQQAGTYTATVDVPGITASVEPSSVTLAKGESATVKITLTVDTAPASQWATGFLTWQSSSTAVRSPIVVRPLVAAAPALVEGSGVTGTTDVTITAGQTGEIPLNLAGLAKQQLLTTATSPAEHSGNETTREMMFITTVESSTEVARFDLTSGDPENTDLDLQVYRVVGPDDLRYYEKWESATAAANESVVLNKPTAGTYAIAAKVYSFTQPFTWDMATAFVKPGQAGSLTATPNPLAGERGVETTYQLGWTDLEPNSTYWGLVRYGDSDVTTQLKVASGAATPALTLSGKAIPRCLGGNVAVAMRVVNDNAVPVTIKLTSPWGEKSYADVKPGAAVALTLTARAPSITETAVQAIATATVGGAEASTTLDLPVAATTCG